MPEPTPCFVLFLAIREFLLSIIKGLANCEARKRKNSVRVHLEKLIY